jgi:hypothetical protein
VRNNIPVVEDEESIHTITHCGLGWKKKRERDKLVRITGGEEIIIYSVKVN